MPKRLPGHGRSIIDDLRDERLVVGLILTALVTALAVLQAIVTRTYPVQTDFVYLLGGPAVAIYGSVLSVCIDPRRGWLPAALFLILGATQPVWLLGGDMAILLWSVLLLAPAWWAVRRWWAPIPLVLALLLAGVLIGWSIADSYVANELGLGVAVLHLSLSWTLCAAVVERTWRIVPQPATHCPTCGYPREGLPTNVCPECGAAFPTP